MSMLASQQEFAQKDLAEAEQRKVLDKELQQAEVDEAQWKFFQGALKRDHSKILQAHAAPRLVKQRLHAKSVAHRSKLASEGEAACKGYQETSWESVCVCVCETSFVCLFVYPPTISNPGL